MSKCTEKDVGHIQTSSFSFFSPRHSFLQTLMTGTYTPKVGSNFEPYPYTRPPF